MLACFLSLLNFVFTYTLYCCGHLSPTLSLVFNFILFGLWTTCLGLLASNMQGTLTTTCDIAHWGNDTGVAVCRDYKAFFAFLVLALVSHLMAVVIDLVAWRKRQDMGEYGAMDIKLHERGDSAFLIPNDINEHDPRPDAYTGALGTERLADQDALDQSAHPMPYRDHLAPAAHLPTGETQEYYDDVPDVPASADTWNRGDELHFSPLQAKADTQPGFEPYRPHGY
jgi:hypothetical protein